MKTTFSQIVKTTAHCIWTLLGLLIFVFIIDSIKDAYTKKSIHLGEFDTYLSDNVKIVHHNDKEDLVFVPTGKKLVKDFHYNEYQKNDSLFLFSSHGLFGYVNRYTGDIIPPQYEFAGSFRYDLATVVKGNRLYFINRQEKLVIPYSYAVPEEPSDCQFHHRHCVVTVDGSHFGVIDLQGKWVVQPIYDEIKLCNDYCIAHTYGQFSKQIDYDGHLIRTRLVDAFDTIPNSDLLLYRTNGSCGLITKDLHLVTQPIYSDISYLGNQRYKARLLDKESYVFIDHKGNELLLK